MPVADAPRRRHMHRLVKAGGIISAGLVLATQALSGGGFAGGESTDQPPSAFFTYSGLAAAGGGRFHLVVPGAPASDAVLDPGGPTAHGVVSDAAFRASVLAAGPVTLGRVTATATRALKTSGEINQATSLEVVGADVGGTKFSLTSAGLTLAGTAVPLPIEPGLKSLNEQLARSGAAVRFSPERKTSDGVVAPVFEITVPF